MTEQYKKYTLKSIWVAIFAFCIRCLLSKTKIIGEFSAYDVYGYAGEAIAFATIVMILYEKYIWRFNLFEKTPVLMKSYTGTLKSTYDGVERAAKLTIKQTLLSVSVIMETGESKSKAVSAAIENIQDEWQLTYTYLNVPDANVRDRSAIHYGTALLSIEDPVLIKGQYFTDRKTIGDMKFEAINQ